MQGFHWVGLVALIAILIFLFSRGGWRFLFHGGPGKALQNLVTWLVILTVLVLGYKYFIETPDSSGPATAPGGLSPDGVPPASGAPDAPGGLDARSGDSVTF